MDTKQKIFEEAMDLKPHEKAQLINSLISALDKPDKEINEAWASEVEDRINALNQGKLTTVSLEEVLEKYR